ncbi:MAG TPA: hypothetical protein VMT20_17340 [Terriglobia bacterium]|nr:hypothetical protein [Terriglobia bacterium]
MRNKLMCTLWAVALLTLVSVGIGAAPAHGQEFSISAQPSVATTRPGAKATYSVVVGSRAFEGTVALSCQSGAPGVTCWASPSSVWVSSTLTPLVKVVAAVSSGTPAGTYHLTITATGIVNNTVNQTSTTVTLLVE